MEPVQVEIRIENDKEVSFIPSNIHAKPAQEVVFFVTTREAGGERIRPGRGQAREVVNEDDQARFTITFNRGSPFDDVKLSSSEGRIKAAVKGEPGIYHYALAATTEVAGESVVISVTGCPEIIIER
jgi:hypothetical protein